MTSPRPGQDGCESARVPASVPADESRTAGRSRRQPSVGRAAPPEIESADLLQGGGEVHILHQGDTYRLTVTRAGKLILHK